jgi:hypothetical protein
MLDTYKSSLWWKVDRLRWTCSMALVPIRPQSNGLFFENILKV